MKNCITFILKIIAKKIFFPIAQEAKKRNFETKFTKNFNQSSDIGFYCKSTGINLKSKHPIIFLGGMDQGRENWPNAWQKEDLANLILDFYLEKLGHRCGKRQVGFINVDQNMVYSNVDGLKQI